MRSQRKTILWSIAFTSTNKMWLRLKHNQDLFWGAKSWVCWKQDSDWGPGSADTIMVISNYLCTWPTILQLSPWHLLEHSITMTQWVPFWWTDTHEWHCLYIYNPNYNLHNYFVLPSFRTILWSPLSPPPVYIRFHQNGYLWLSESVSIIYILVHNVKNSFVLVKGTTVVAKQ